MGTVEKLIAAVFVLTRSTGSRSLATADHGGCLLAGGWLYVFRYVFVAVANL